MREQQIRAWAVHLYTMSGGVVGMFGLFAAAQGETRLAFGLLFLAMLIDATDGILARRADVRGVLPGFDGAMVDNVIDFLTYIWIPVFIMWREQLLPHPAWLAIPIIAGLYAYGQVNMKSNDAFFIGFPSYWNGIALYLFWLRPEALGALLLISVPAVLTFIPTRYLYPSKNPILGKVNWLLGAAWGLLVFYLLAQEQPNQSLVLLSLSYPVFYMLSSFYVDWRIRQGNFARRA
jgi:phosphatidylcholine synthase